MRPIGHVGIYCIFLYKPRGNRGGEKGRGRWGERKGRGSKGGEKERRRGGGSKVCTSLGMSGVASYSQICKMVPFSSQYVTDCYIDLTMVTEKESW